MHFTHLLDFVEVDHETALISVVLFDTLPTEDSKMVGAVEVLDPLIMLVAQKAIDAILIFEVDIPQDIISFHDFVQDIKVEG